MPEIYTGIEIGTATTKVAICSLSDDGGITLLGWGEVPSIKIIKREVKDPDTACELLYRAVKQAEKEAGISITDTFIVLSVGDQRLVKLVRTRGKEDWGDKNKQIQAEHFINAARKAKYKPKDDSLLVDTGYTRFYRINQNEILLKPPIGSYSTYIEVENESIVYYKRPLEAYLSIVIDAVNEKLDAIAYTPVLLQFAMLPMNANHEMIDGCLMIDIGAGVTSYALHTGYDFFTVGQIAVGCDHAANDLSIHFALPITSTRTILRNFAKLQCSVMPEQENSRRFIAASLEINDTKKNISASRVEQIVQVRFQELFHMINEKIINDDAWQWATGGVLISGGGALIPKITDLASSIFKRPVSVARPYKVNGRPEIVNSPTNVVPFGLIRYGKQSHDVEKENHPQGIVEWTKAFFRAITNW